MHDMFEEQVASFVEIVKMQQKTSIELTKIILEHSKFSDLDEKEIYKIFENAAEVVAKTFEKSFRKQ